MDRQEDWHGRESPEINPFKDERLVSNEGGFAYQWGQELIGWGLTDINFNKQLLGENKLDLQLPLCTKKKIQVSEGFQH